MVRCPRAFLKILRLSPFSLTFDDVCVTLVKMALVPFLFA